ncbi:MAG: RsmD family RNA methyltransferase [Pirellulales bacterium]
MPKRQIPRTPAADAEPRLDSPPRIVGGRFRGRKLLYSGDARTRPMKDRVREAVFNLVGPSVVGTQAIDLFAGTGALGLEALSRGAARATFVEQHQPTARLIEQNIAHLGVLAQCEVVVGSALLWPVREPPAGDAPWTVFFSPPWEFFRSKSAEMLGQIERLARLAPPGSTLVVEADLEFDASQLPANLEWDVRDYLPARVGVGRIAPASGPQGTAP